MTSQKIHTFQFSSQVLRCLFSKFRKNYPSILFSNSYYFPGLKNIASTEFTVCNIILFPFADCEALDVQYLYNVISRARVLCRVHMLVIKDESNEETQNSALKQLLDVFQNARIECGENYVAELLSLTCNFSTSRPACNCLYLHHPRLSQTYSELSTCFCQEGYHLC